MLSRLRIGHRLLLILVATVIGFGAVTALTLLQIRANLLDERKEQLQNIVHIAVDTVSYFHRLSESGALSEPEAQEQARNALRDIRFGANDYVFAYREDGTCLVFGPAQKREGTAMLDVTDQDGVKVVAEIIAAARAGGGFFGYRWPRNGSSETFPKLSYALPFQPWGWAIGTGVYIDDLDATFWATAKALGGAVAVVVALVGCGIVWIGRSITRPLSGLNRAMGSLAEGDTNVVVEGTAQSNELGEMARTVEIFKTNAIEKRRLEAQQEELERTTKEKQRRALLALADSFEADVKTVVDSVGNSAGQMQSTAESMSQSASEASRRADTVADASQTASANVQTVASAAEELSSAIREIGKQVGEAHNVTRRAAEGALATQARVRNLAEAAEKIGSIVALINDISAQTNLLALNATIEAARAGDAGRGFAVVANEVKGLAGQTARATEEIASQVEAVRSEIGGTVGAIEDIVETVNAINEISAGIAAAVEEQDSATREIAHSVEQAAVGTQEVSENIEGVSRAAGETGSAASLVLDAATELSRRSAEMRRYVETFLSNVRAA